MSHPPSPVKFRQPNSIKPLCSYSKSLNPHRIYQPTYYHELQTSYKLPVHVMLQAYLDVVLSMPKVLVLLTRTSSKREPLFTFMCIQWFNTIFRIGLDTVKSVLPPITKTIWSLHPHLLSPSWSKYLLSSFRLKKVSPYASYPSIPPLMNLLERPRIISIDCLPSLATKEGSAPMPLLDHYMPEGRPEGIVLTQGLSGEPLRFPLHLWYSPTALSRCKPVNRAIYHITSGAARKAWCGTVVVLKFNGSRRLGYSDAGSNDLPALSAYFLAYK